MNAFEGMKKKGKIEVSIIFSQDMQSQTLKKFGLEMDIKEDVDGEAKGDENKAGAAN